jgi:hypothetical protein
MDVHCWLLLGLISGNRPLALLNFRYRHVFVTLLRDPQGGQHRVRIELTFEFTKQFLGLKDA